MYLSPVHEQLQQPFSEPSSISSTPASASSIDDVCSWFSTLTISSNSKHQISTKVVEHEVDTEALGLMSFDEFISMLGLVLPAGDLVKVKVVWENRPTIKKL